jgi:hypothetical protein
MNTDNLITIGLAVCLIVPTRGIISNNQQSATNAIINTPTSKLFENVDSIGNVAICYAEGNCEKGGKSRRYTSHIDPGNGKLNKGYCSSQKPASSTQEANNNCLKRTNEALPRINNLLASKGISDTLFYVNVVDSHNQAADWAWQNAVSYYAENKSKLSGDELIIESRVYGFYRNGKLDAEGLFNACNIDGKNQVLAYKCIRHDQQRRFKEIKRILDNGR